MTRVLLGLAYMMGLQAAMAQQHWVQATPHLNLQAPSRWRAIMEDDWDPVHDPVWWIGFFSEGGSSSWSLELSPNFKTDNHSERKPIFRLSHSSVSC